MPCTPCYTADLPGFRLEFPEFDPVADPTVQDQLDKADCVLSEDAWGCTKPQAQLYYAAHFIAVSQNAQANTQVSSGGFVITSSGAGAITSASAGAISVGYAPTATAAQGNDFNAPFTTTRYGQMFLALKYARMPIGILATCQ